MGRDAMVEHTINFSINVGTAAAPLTNTVAPILAPGSFALNWGATTAFGSFPISSNMNTANVQINNTSTSVNLKDVLPQLLRLNDSRYLYKYNSYAPSLPDQAYYSYSSGDGANNNPMGSYNTASYDVDQVPRGAFPLTGFNVEHYGIDAAGASALLGTTLVMSADVAAPGGQYFIVNITAVITEPIFVSPFTWSSPEENAQGLLGVNNMAMNFTMDSTLSRLLSNSNALISSVVAGDARGAPSNSTSNFFTKSQILLKFLSTQDTDRLQTKNVVPFMDFPRYITSQTNTIPAAVGNAVGAATTIQSNNIQLNQLPDYFIICARKKMSSQGRDDADAFLKINSATFNLNNMSGLLSTAQPQDLWKISMKNGSNQSWAEFSGQSWTNAIPGGSVGAGANVGTTGSLLVVSPTDLSLPSYLAPGSLGNFQLSLSVSVSNQSSDAVDSELVVIAVNSGFMVTQMGQSAVYTGVLTREAVLDAKQQKPVSESQYHRLVGGKLLNRVCTAVADKSQRKVGMGEMSAGGRLSGLY